MFRKKSPPPPSGRVRPQYRPSDAGRTVFSYHANRSARPGAGGRQEQPAVTAASNQRRNERRKWFRRSPVLIGLLLLAVVVVLNLPVSGSVHIVPAEQAAGGIFLRPVAVYADAARQLLKSSIWQSNKLTINTGQLERDLQHQFPELGSVSVDLPLLGTKPVIYVEPSVPSLILAPSAGEFYVVDQNGRALIDASEVKGLEKLKLPTVRDESRLPVELGQAVLPSSNVAYITEVLGQLKAKQLVVESMVLPAAASELDVKVQGLPYIVKFNLQGDAREEAGAYLAVKLQLDREKKMPGTYIDVRVPDRAYYR